jgi:PAS domain S-box-containing protein
MDRLLNVKCPILIVAAALCWTLIVDLIISQLAHPLLATHGDLFQSVNYFMMLLLVSLILYRRINHQAQEVLKARDEYRRLFEEIPVPMFIFDSRTFRFLAVNNAATCKYGYSREEFLHMKITEIRPPEEIAAFLDGIGQVTSCYSDVGRWLHRKKNGDTFYVQIFSHHTTFEGLPVKQSVVIDIDLKVHTEKALAVKTAELEDVLESTTDAFYTVDREWNFTYINKQYEKIQKRDRTKLLGKNAWELFPYGKEHRYYKEYERALREQVSVHFEEFNRFNGMWISASAYPIQSGLAIYFRDITQEKLMRDKILKDSQNLKAIINNTRDLIWSVDLDFEIIAGNEAFWERVEQLTGKTREKINNADFEQEFMQPILDSYRRAFNGEAFLTVRQRYLDGRKRFEELSFNPIVNQKHEVTGVNCYLRDISRLQEHVEQIEKQNDKLRKIAWIHSHKVRGPVASILGLAQLCKLDLTADREIISMLMEATKQLDERICEITALAQDLDEIRQ